MKFILLLAAAGTIFISCHSKDKKTTETMVPVPPPPPLDSTLVTDSSWGLISRSANIDSLKSWYGAAAVKDERICGAECLDSVDVTIVYPESSREFVIYWNDSSYHKQIAFIRASGDSSPYHTASGIKTGTTLKTLVQLNGKPIAFLGFGWDYGGGIISLNKGLLENPFLHFNLDLTDGNGENTLFGDTELNTEMPSVKKYLDKIQVSELSLSFNN